MPKLAHSLNRALLVASPDFFGDDQPHRCILTDIESAGLWLRGDTVNERLRALIEEIPPGEVIGDVFLPFDQIAYVFDPAQIALSVKSLVARAAAEDADEEPPRPGRGRHRSEPKHKTSKRTR